MLDLFLCLFAVLFCASLWLQFEIEIEVAGETDGLAVNYRWRENPGAGRLFRSLAQQHRPFRTCDPNLSVFIDDGEHADRAGDIVCFGLRRISRRHAFRFAAGQWSRADELGFRPRQR